MDVLKINFGTFDLGNVMNFRNGVAAFSSGFVGPALSKVYGGDLHIWFVLVLVFAITYDWVAGSAAAKKDGTYASAYGIQGIMRTAVLLSLPAFGSMLDIIFRTPGVFFFVFWGGILFHTLTSMTANSKRAGWDRWIPLWAIEWVASEIEAKVKRSKERQGE